MRLYKPHPRASLPLRVATSVAIILAALLSGIAQPQQPGTDWIYVVDTSLSMLDTGSENKSIAASVKDAIKESIDHTKPGDTVTVYTFDSQVSTLYDRQPINTQLDKDNLKRVIDKTVDPKGKFTHTGEAVQNALKQSERIKSEAGAANRLVMILLFTDGREDVADQAHPVRLAELNPVSLLSKDKPYLYVIWLSNKPLSKELTDFLNLIDEGHKKVFTARTSKQIESSVDEIRPQSPAPKEINLEVQPQDVDFGQVAPGGLTPRRPVQVTSNVDTPARIALADSPEGGVTLDEPQERVELKAGNNQLSLRLRIPRGAPNSARVLRLIISPEASDQNVQTKAADIGVRAQIYKAPLVVTAGKWLVGLLFLTLLALLAFAAYKGQRPLDLWRNFQERNYLEGEVEWLQPGSGDVIALRTYRAARLRIGSLFPELSDAITDGADAELVAVHRNGNKITQLRCLQGSVRVNDEDVSVYDLYDGDRVRLGRMLIRYNSLHVRPQTDVSEEI